MTQSEFYGWAIPQLIEEGITVHLVHKLKTKNCCGWFSAEKKELVVCTANPDAFAVFVHEFCHFLQYRDARDLWNKLGKACDNFFRWLDGDKYTQRQVNYFCKQAQLLELDCENRAIALIKKLKLDIDLKEYIQKANAYLLSYPVTKELRLWPNTLASIYSSDISDLFSSKLVTAKQLTNKKYIPKKALELWESRCYNLNKRKFITLNLG